MAGWFSVTCVIQTVIQWILAWLCQIQASEFKSHLIIT